MTLCTTLFSIALLTSTKHCCPSKCPSTGNRLIYGSAYNGILCSLGKKKGQGSCICTNIKQFLNYFMHKKQNTQLYMLVLVFLKNGKDDYIYVFVHMYIYMYIKVMIYYIYYIYEIHVYKNIGNC